MKWWMFVVVPSVAFAEAAPGGGASGVTPFIPMLIIFAIFYFLVLRPQSRKQKLQQKFINELKRGDMVVTSSGIVGVVKAVSDKFATIEVDEGVCLKIVKSQIAESANTLKEEKAPKGKEVQAT